MQIWYAHYKDALHDTDIQITNSQGEHSSDPLSFTLDGVSFRGSSLGDIGLADPSQYEDIRSRFHILKVSTAKPGTYHYYLQRYSLDVDIPVKVVRKSDNCTVNALLHIAFEYVEHDINKRNQVLFRCDNERVYWDDPIVHDLSLSLDNKCYRCQKDTLCFEYALEDISRQIKEDHFLKCCFTCQYADYSPYGSDDFGTMLCYRSCKEDYIKVNSKDEYFLHLFDKQFDTRQETFLCDEYSPRNKCGGYRGYVDGVSDI